MKGLYILILAWILAIIYCLYDFYERKLSNKYTIEQCFFSGNYKTYIWYNGDIVESYSIPVDSISKQRKTQDSLKAVKLIQKLNYFKP